MTPTHYYPTIYPKKQIVLHHTAGSHHPLWVCDGWRAQKKKIGTAYVIGGKANPPYQDLYDGIVEQYFPETGWAHHLGISESNYSISKATIGIELCSYGQLIRAAGGKYITYVGTMVPKDQVVQVDFRGFQFWEKYTEKQIYSLKELLKQIAERNSIDLREGIQKLLKNGNKAFELQSSALAGKPGLWTHGNYRRDKLDCSPQPDLVEMIMEL